jgi:hypothetical protein
VFTAGRKVLFDLFIPAELVLTGYVGRELREFIAAQLVHCLLDFGEAHAVKVSLCDTNRQATVARRAISESAGAFWPSGQVFEAKATMQLGSAHLRVE